jgi:Periplasmic copper-binding protein (NosD)
MRRLLGLVVAALAATLLFALGAGQALGATVNCGDTITQDTTLDSDLLGCSSPALTIAGNDVTLDLNGHVVDGGVTTSRSETTYPPGTRVVVENGTVKNGGLNISSYEFATVRRVVSGAIRVVDSGTVLVQRNRVVKESLTGGGTVFGEDSGGSSTGEDVRVIHNVISGGNEGVGFGRGTKSALVAHNLITGNGVGVDAGRGAPLTVVDNIIRANSFGGIGIGTASLVASNNVIRDNGNYGVHLVFASAELTGNVISGNGGNGIEVPDHAGLTVSKNVVSRNGGDGVFLGEVVSGRLGSNRIDRNRTDGVHVTDFNSHVTLIGNHTWFNGNLGIEALPGTLGGDNWAKHNGNPLQCVPGSLCNTTGKPKG